MSAAKHILVTRFSSMGDVAMTVPIIKALLVQNPHLSVTVVSRPAFAAFFQGIERLDFFPADLKVKLKGFAGIVKLFNDLRKHRPFDAIADLHDTLRTKILRNLFRISGKKVIHIDKGRAEKKLLTRFPNKVLKPLKRTTERYADVFRQLGFPVKLDYLLHKEEAVLANDITKITGTKDQPWIGITPFAQYKGKTYPVEKMEEVINHVLNYSQDSIDSHSLNK